MNIWRFISVFSFWLVTLRFPGTYCLPCNGRYQVFPHSRVRVLSILFSQSLVYKLS